MARLRARARQGPGSRVTLLAAPRTPPENLVGQTIYLSHRHRQDLPVRFPDQEQWDRLSLAGHEGELVQLTVRVYPTDGPLGVEARVDADSLLQAPDPARSRPGGSSAPPR